MTIPPPPPPEGREIPAPPPRRSVPPPPPPDGTGATSRRARRASAGAPRSRGRRILRAVRRGILTGLVAVFGLVFFVSSRVGPAPEVADVCREVPGNALDDPIGVGVALASACEEIDTTLDLPLGGTDGFEGVVKAPSPPSSPGVVRPAYLDWTSDGCSAPVLGAGPFDFTLPCERHDFGWRNLKLVHDSDAPIWHVGNKDRVDAGFLYDMRVDCAALSPIWRVGCDTTARIYYTAIRLNPAGAEGLPGRQ